MTSAINVVVYMQLFWCSSKIYYSNILQLEEFVFQAFDTNYRKKNVFWWRKRKYRLDMSQCISGNIMPLIAHVTILNLVEIGLWF